MNEVVDDTNDASNYNDRGHDDNHAIAKLGKNGNLIYTCMLWCAVLRHSMLLLLLLTVTVVISGEWLRDQQTMEDTITILQQEGWMV